MIDDTEVTIDLRLLWKCFVKNLTAIAVTAIICTVAGFCLSSFVIPKKYEASSLLYVESTKSRGETLNINDITAAQKTAATCQIIFQSNRMLSAVIFELDLPYSKSELADMISVTPLNNTEVIEISAVCSNPKMASDIVNVLSDLSKDEFKRVVKQGSIEVVEYAKPAQTHFFPNILLFTVGGFVAGAVAMYVIALLRQMFSITVTPDDDLATIYEVPVFAEIADFEASAEEKSAYSAYSSYDTSKPDKKTRGRRSSKERYVLDETTPFIISEAYKAARTNIIFSLAGCEHKIIGFTSPEPGECKSTTCDNIAISFADMGKRVLLIDCDLRKPTVHTAFRISNSNGLSTLLSSLCGLDEAVTHDVRPSLDVITAGPIPPNPTELLSSKRMKILLEGMEQRYDLILLDTPPVNIVTDTLLLNDIIGGHVLVVRESTTTHPGITEAFSRIDLATGKKLGIIKACCNIGEKTGKRYGKYGKYGHYGHYSYSYGGNSSDEDI